MQQSASAHSHCQEHDADPEPHHWVAPEVCLPVWIGITVRSWDSAQGLGGGLRATYPDEFGAAGGGASNGRMVRDRICSPGKATRLIGAMALPSSPVVDRNGPRLTGRGPFAASPAECGLILSCIGGSPAQRHWSTLASVCCSAPMVVLSPWPVRTTVSAGRVRSRSRMEARMVG